MMIKEKENSEFVFLISSGITGITWTGLKKCKIGKIRYYVFRVTNYLSYFKLTKLFFTRVCLKSVSHKNSPRII